MPKKDYYNILGVTKDADEQTIRKAYKKLALKWHPDRNLDNKLECEEKFKEIAEAYEVLSDSKKKHAYDHGGVDELYHDYGTHFMHDPFEMFDRLFENFGFINSHRSHKRRNSFFDDPFFNIDMTFGDFSLFDSPNTSTFTSISSFGGHGNFDRGHFTSTSIQTSIINGKKITTKQINQNGKEIIEKYENGELIEKYIDGVSQKHQAIGYHHHISAEKNHHNHQSHHNHHHHQQHQSHLEQFLQEEEEEEENEKELQQQFERRKKKIFGRSHHSNSCSHSHSHSHSHSQSEAKIKIQQNNNHYHHQKHYNQSPKYSPDVKQFLQEDNDDSNQMNY